MFLIGMIGAAIGFVLGLGLCLVIDLLRYGPDDPRWPYDEFLYEAIVVACGIMSAVIAFRFEDKVLSLF